MWRLETLEGAARYQMPITNCQDRDDLYRFGLRLSHDSSTRRAACRQFVQALARAHSVPAAALAPACRCARRAARCGGRAARVADRVALPDRPGSRGARRGDDQHVFHRVPRGCRRVRHVRGAALLHGVVARRARRRRHSQRGLRARDPHGPDLLRGHAHRRSAVAAHGGYDARAVDRRLRNLDHAAVDHLAVRLRLVLLVATSLRAHADHRDGDAVHRCCRSWCSGGAAPALARLAGSHRGRERASPAETLNAIQTVQAFTLEELHTERFRDAVEHSFLVAVRRIRCAACSPRSRRRWCSAPSRSCSGSARTNVLAGSMTVGELSPVPSLRGLHGVSAAALERDVGRRAARRRRMERLVELRARAPAIQAPAHAGRAAAPPARPNSFRQRDLPLSFAARVATALDDFSARRSSPARRSLSSARPARARARRSSCCCASTIRSRAACCSTASTSRTLDPQDAAPRDRPRAAGHGALRQRRAREHPLRPARMRATTKSMPRRRGAAPTSSCERCRRATTRSSASAACGCRAASGSASRSRARF